MKNINCKTLYAIVLIFSMLNCTDYKKDIDKEHLLREKELDLREQNLKLKEENSLASKNKEEQNNLPEIYKKVKSSVYLIYSQKLNGVAQGSAFVISPNGLAISNYHVFDGASDAIAINDNDEKFLISEIIEYSEQGDYIIFRLNTTRPLPYLKISDDLSEIGEECFAVGNPKGLTQTLSKGIISSYRDDNRIIQTTTEITYGSSGGALFNKKGEVIGITSGGKGDANLNFAINIANVPYGRYLESSSAGEIRNNNINETQLKKLIANYYYYIENDMFSDLNSILSPTIKRYFAKYNISKNEVVDLARTYNQQFEIISIDAKVRWDSFNIHQLDNGDYAIDYILDYTLERRNKSKPSKFILHMNVEVNKDYQIQGIYENILDKN